MTLKIKLLKATEGGCWAQLESQDQAMKKLTQYNECWQCINKRPVPGNAHIKCINPDPEMTGSEHGKKNGWFFYPSCFDPVWKTKKCNNFEQKIIK